MALAINCCVIFFILSPHHHHSNYLLYLTISFGIAFRLKTIRFEGVQIQRDHIFYEPKGYGGAFHFLELSVILQVQCK